MQSVTMESQNALLCLYYACECSLCQHSAKLLLRTLHNVQHLSEQCQNANSFVAQKFLVHMSHSCCCNSNRNNLIHCTVH